MPGFIGRYFAPRSMIVAIPEDPVAEVDSILLALRPAASGEVLPLKLLGIVGGWIWAVLPDNAPIGPATITLTTAGGSEQADILVQPSAIGILTLSQGGGRAKAQVSKADAGLVPITLSNPARAGDVVTLWLTGLGSVAGNVSVDLAGKRITPLFAGRAPGQLGVDQINFVVPPEAAFGCYVPLRVRAGTAVSDAVTIPTASTPGPCSHPLGLSADQLLLLDRGAPVLIGSFSLSTDTGDPILQTESAASARLIFHWELDATLGPPLLAQGVTSCSPFVLGGAGVNISVLNSSRDAGGSVVLHGPAAASITVPAIAEGYYDKALDPAALMPGLWTLAVPGGAGIAAFEASLSVPKPLRLLNPEALHAFSRDGDLEIDWAPDDFSSGDAVSAFLQAWSFQSPPFGADALGISCIAPARDGRLVVPRELLALLPPDPSGDRGTIQLMVVPNQGAPNVVAAPLVSGGTAPVVMGYASNQWLHVAIR